MIKTYSINHLLACIATGNKVFPKSLFYTVARKYIKHKDYIDRQELKASQAITRQLDKRHNVNTYNQEFQT